MFQGIFLCWKTSSGMSKEKTCCPAHNFLVILAAKEMGHVLVMDFPPCMVLY